MFKQVAAVTLAVTLLSASPVVEPVASSDAATLIGVTASPTRRLTPREYVAKRASRHGWTFTQWRCAVRLINRENMAWDVEAENRQGSSAYGLFQILHTPKGTPLREQTTRFLNYIASRYNNDPCAAWNHHQQHGWY